MYRERSSKVFEVLCFCWRNTLIRALFVPVIAFVDAFQVFNLLMQ